MQELYNRNKAHSYLFYVIAILFLLSSIFFKSVLAFVLSSFILLVSVAYYRSGHIINNMLLERGTVIESSNSFKLGYRARAAARMENGSYLGIAIAVLYPKEDTKAEQVRVTELLESIKQPFEYCIGLAEVDKSKIIDSLEEKRRLKEIAISRMEKRYDKINGATREIEVLTKEINDIKASGKSYVTSIKIKALSNEANEFAACREAYDSLIGITNAFSASIGIDYRILSGEELASSIL